MNTVLITGVNGFVGSHLAGELVRSGWRVFGTTRSAAGLDTPVDGVAETRWLDLGAPVAPEIFSGAHTVIHCAYDLRSGAIEQNVAAIECAAEAAAAAGAARQIFLSSYSAHEAAVSAYGRTKFTLQRRFLALGHAVVRPGLIVGPGGMFARMAEALRWPLMPLPDGGCDRVPVVALADFLAATAAVAAEGRAGLVNLFHPELPTLKELFAAIRAMTGGRTLFVPVPANALMALARLAEKIGAEPPFDAENFRALRVNQGRQERSDLAAFVTRPLALAEMVASASRALERRKARGRA